MKFYDTKAYIGNFLYLPHTHLFPLV
uniref:Uncharacterized protein n=1 Tax=Arundo donax TaxID=35708 RepID=A0A0A8YPM5_ARUDO